MHKNTIYVVHPQYNSITTGFSSNNSVSKSFPMTQHRYASAIKILYLENVKKLHPKKLIEKIAQRLENMDFWPEIRQHPAAFEHSNCISNMSSKFI